MKTLCAVANYVSLQHVTVLLNVGMWHAMHCCKALCSYIIEVYVTMQVLTSDFVQLQQDATAVMTVQ